MIKMHYYQTALAFFIIILFAACQPAKKYDIVLKGGRVMDPETGLDAIRNIGITGNTIARISETALEGNENIDVTGHVVAPGFIDLHVHGMTNKAHRYQVRDGVTTALDLESGRPFLKKWLASKDGNTIVNYGATVPHGYMRTMAMEGYGHYIEAAEKVIAEEGFESPQLMKIMINMGRSARQILSSDEMVTMKELIQQELSDGALGIGVPVGYYPGAGRDEIFFVYQIAAEYQVTIFSHTRGIGIEGIYEAIANATSSGAPLHIVHANSLSLSNIQVTLDMVASAQERGLDITTEIYPYTAASTSLESAIFADGWRETLGISYGDLQWEATGERLTEEAFTAYREKGGTVIIHMMKPEWIIKGIKDPRTMIGSDGMPYAPGAHPRTAGTFSRVLGKYVREEKAVDLMEALAKMTIMPAQRLEPISQMMTQKGRMQEGMDADITVFDPETIIDRADFKSLEYSEGIPYVFVNGVLVVKGGENVADAFPGKPVTGDLDILN